MKMTLASDVILFLAVLADLNVSGTLFSISFVRLATKFAVVNHTFGKRNQTDYLIDGFKFFFYCS